MVEVNLSSEKSHKEKNKNGVTRKVGIFRHRIWTNGFVVSIRYLHLTLRVLFLLLLSRSHLCHYSVGGAWWHLGFYESFQYPVWAISPATGVERKGMNMTE
jgi:hypothetical protein